MARKRMIDPNIWQSEDFSKLSTLAKLVFIGLFSNADDYGRGRAKAAYIKSILFPYDEGMRVIDVDKTLSEIGSNMSVTFYLHDENEYYSLDKWSKWQRVDKPSESNIPPYDDGCAIIRRTFGESSANVRRILAERSPNPRRILAEDSRLKEVKRNEQEGNKKRKREGASAPALSPLKPERHKHGEYGWVKLSDAEFQRLTDEYGDHTVNYYITVVDEYAQTTQNKNKYADWNLVIRKAIREKWGAQTPKEGENRNGIPGANSQSYGGQDDPYRNIGSIKA